MNPHEAPHDGQIPNDHLLNVLVVCTANTCRSPVAELLLRRTLDPTVAIGSAGTHAGVGQPLLSSMAEVLAERSLAPPRASSRPITVPLIERAALILTLTASHRAAVVTLVPSAVRRTFTLREFERLVTAHGADPSLGLTDAERLRALIPLAVAQRAAVAATRQHDDVDDPVGRSRAAHRRSFAEIDAAVRAITTTLHPSAASGPVETRLSTRLSRLSRHRFGSTRSAHAGT